MYRVRSNQLILLITDFLAGISQFLVQGNLGQNTPNSGVTLHQPTTVFGSEYS